MDLDRIIHDKKNFAELSDADVKAFLQFRTFKSEHLNLEFKSEFPQKKNGGYDIKKICKYIAGFSNEEGGLIVYGVADSIKDPAVNFPAYVVGLSRNPSLEDLSQWIKERIHPLAASPAIRFFDIDGRSVAILKTPSGINQPYCYYDPSEKTVTYFKKTPGGIIDLKPDEIRELYRTNIIEQSRRILRAEELRGEVRDHAANRGPTQWEKHEKLITPKLEDPTGFGLVGIYSHPTTSVDIPVHDLQKFIEQNRFRFAEEIKHLGNVDVFQTGVSVGYFPRAIRREIKSTYRLSLYESGLVAVDAQADIFMDKDRYIHAGWLTYELQRHLQLAKALLESYASKIVNTVNFRNIEDWSLGFPSQLNTLLFSKYAGQNEPIQREINLSDIYDAFGPKRNIVMPPVQDLMEEISRIFGLSKVPAGLWDNSGYLLYVKGLENTR
jgi:Schlafen, AlbA_2